MHVELARIKKSSTQIFHSLALLTKKSTEYLLKGRLGFSSRLGHKASKLVLAYSPPEAQLVVLSCTFYSNIVQSISTNIPLLIEWASNACFKHLCNRFKQ